MTKTQLIEALAKQAGVEKKEAKQVLDGLTSLIHTTMKKGGEVKLQELGKFKVVKRKARMGRNPATGAPIKIAAKTVAKFYVAKSLRDIVKK